MSTPAARTWKSLIEMEELGLADRYTTAICNLAAMQAQDHLQQLEEEGKDISQMPVPDTSDPDAILRDIQNGSRPPWWPQRIERMGIEIIFKPDGMTQEKIGPHPVDPNGPDAGIGTFMSLASSLCDAVGTPFTGNVRIKIIRMRNRDLLGGFKGDVYIGDKSPKDKKGRGRESDDRDDQIEYHRSQSEKKDEMMQRMFANSANVIHASASAINSMRGVNVAPPWMNGGEEGEMPMWMMLAKGAMDMVLAAGLGQNPGQAGMQSMQSIMRQPVPQGPPQMGAHAPAGYLPGPQHHAPQQPADHLGYSDYQEDEGEYDGYYASDEDMLDDDWGNGDAWEDDEDWYEEEEEEYEEEGGYAAPRGGGESRRDQSRGDDINELFARVNAYIDKHPEDRDQIKRLGLGLLPKLT